MNMMVDSTQQTQFLQFQQMKFQQMQMMAMYGQQGFPQTSQTAVLTNPPQQTAAAVQAVLSSLPTPLQRRQYLASILSPKVQQLLSPGHTAHLQKVLATLTDLELFEEAEVVRLFTDAAHLEETVKESITLIETGH